MWFTHRRNKMRSVRLTENGRRYSRRDTSVNTRKGAAQTTGKLCLARVQGKNRSALYLVSICKHNSTS